MDAIGDAVGALVEGVANVVKFTLAAVGVFVLIAVTALLMGFVARDYWNWFVAPLGPPRIGILQAFGLMLFIGFLRGPKQHEEDDSAAESIAKLASGLAFTWGLGWLVVTFGGPF